MRAVGRSLRTVAVEVLGWVLVAVGIAALVLPGPGLLALFAGLALLSTRYEWASRRVAPVRRAAMRTAGESVRSAPSLAVSLLGVVGLVAAGVVWGLHPPTPDWWPADERLWLPGGWGTGATMIGSAVLALGMIGWSFANFRGEEGRARLERAMERVDGTPENA